MGRTHTTVQLQQSVELYRFKWKAERVISKILRARVNTLEVELRRRKERGVWNWLKLLKG